MKNISSVFTYPWTQDLQFYFKTSLEYLEKLIKVDTAVISNKLKYDCIDLLISSIRQMILHVAQSNRLFFEVPNIHLKHTGTYSKILRAYQGIIKYLLKLAYALPKFSNQSQIIPFINFDVTPIAKSEACPNIIISEDKDNRDKIITIKLPYEALVNIPKYTYLLAHEIYHYIAPEDRKRRNGLLGAVTITIIISQVSVMYIEKYIKERLDINSADISEDDWNKVFSIFKDEIEKNALRFTITEFDKIKGLVNGYKEDAEWGMYFSAIIRALGIGMHNCAQFVNQIYIFLLEMDYDSLIKAAKESQNDNVVKIVRFVIDALMMELENGFEEFYGWVKYFRPNDRITNEANHIQYALREALADYFMLQSIGLNLNAYLEEIMHYKDIISGKDDPRQMNRLGMVIDFVFPELLDAKKNKLADKMEALKNNLITHHSMEESVAESIAISYVQYSSSLKVYKSIFACCFDSLNFSKIDETAYSGFHDILEDAKRVFAINATDEFTQNVQYIERFQIQNKFSEIYKSKISIPYKLWNENIFREIDFKQWKRNRSKDNNYFEKRARTVDAILKYIQEAVKEISDENSFSPIWFRGHENSKNMLIPSLYRMKDSLEKFYTDNVRDTFESLFKAFRVKSFGATEIYKDGNSSVIGTMASMQHYSVPTNILDWSTSVFVAMYFAVESKMVYNTKDINIREHKMEKCTNDADIWLLNPIRLNLAYEYLKRPIAKIDTDLEQKMYPIPSIFGNEEEYQEFLPFAPQNHPKHMFPVAVYVPYVNQRIKSQVGTFTMFSLDAKGAEHTDKDGSYTFKKYDLLEMQNAYKNKAQKNYKPFLARVTISNSCICDFADWLRRMGIDKPKIYPELSNVSTSLTNQIKSFMDSLQTNLK